MGNERKTIVNSWNEWDPLKHVIVGRAEGGMLQAPEPARMMLTMLREMKAEE